MKLKGYQVEFLPLERRLFERRFRSTSEGFNHDQRYYERRKSDDHEHTNKFDSNPYHVPMLTH